MTTEDSVDRRVGQARNAGIVSRTLACTVDAAVLLALLAAAYFGVTAVAFATDPLGFRFPTPPRVLIGATAVIVLIAYLAESWTTSGRTYGAALLGLRVVDHHGHPPRPGRALARATLCVLLPIGLLWAAVSTRRQSIQDLLLHTSVIYDRKG